jgi:predicted phage tail protein
VPVSPPAGIVRPSRRTGFDWSDVGGAGGYTLQISRYVNFSSLLKTAATTASAYTQNTDLPANTLLYWRVQATGANGPSLWSPIWSFTTANPPGIPGLISPVNGGLTIDYTPRLDWATVTVPVNTSFDHYELQLASDAAFGSMLADRDVPGLGASEYTAATDLPPNARYYWRVRAFNTAGQYSAWSAAWSFRTVILPPVLLSPSSGDPVLNRRPALDWQDVAGGTGYKLQISAYSNFATLVTSASTVSSTYTPAADLPPKTLLYWRVKATGPNGPSLWSDTWSFITANPPGIPALISLLNGSLTTDYTPRLDWSTVLVPAGTEFDHYQLQVAPDAAFVSPILDQSVTVLGTSEFTPGVDLPPNSRFYWHVRSFNKSGQYSAWSATWSFRTAILPPVLIAPVDGASLLELRPLLDWADATGATTYTIQVSLYENFSTNLISAGTSATSYLPGINLPRGRLLFWRVRANGTNGPSIWSEVHEFSIQ